MPQIKACPLVAAIAISFVASSVSAVACPAWDLGCEARKIITTPGKAAGEGLKNAERTWNQARTDLSNGLNRIDPRITQMGRDFDALRLKFQSEVFTGPALEQWIVQSRNTARTNAQPVPQEVRDVLRGWYPDGLFNDVRWKTGDGGAVNLANASLSYGDAQAITLIDTIVFKDNESASDFSIWAHEMKHIQQYADWGVHSFAVQYMNSWNSVENPAYDIQGRFVTAWNQQNGTATPGPQTPPPSPPPQQMSNICVVGPQPNARCLLPASFPLQTTCSCTFPGGAVFNGQTWF